MKRIIPILLIAALGYGAYYWWNLNEQAKNANRLQFSGNMELTQTDMSFKLAGRLVELNVREGDMVKKGQVIARIDALQNERQKQRDMAGLGAAESNLKQARTSVALEKETVESDIALKTADIRTAQAKLDNSGMKARPESPTLPISRSSRKAARGK